MDAGYGANTDLRTDTATLGLTYVAGVLPNTSVWGRTRPRCVPTSGLAAEGRRN
jgi:hypothetical protein